jgi:hypothetical protein
LLTVTQSVGFDKLDLSPTRAFGAAAMCMSVLDTMQHLETTVMHFKAAHV